MSSPLLAVVLPVPLLILALSVTLAGALLGEVPDATALVALGINPVYWHILLDQLLCPLGPLSISPFRPFLCTSSNTADVHRRHRRCPSAWATDASNPHLEVIIQLVSLLEDQVLNLQGAD